MNKKLLFVSLLLFALFAFNTPTANAETISYFVEYHDSQLITIHTTQLLTEERVGAKENRNRSPLNRKLSELNGVESVLVSKYQITLSRTMSGGWDKILDPALAIVKKHFKAKLAKITPEEEETPCNLSLEAAPDEFEASNDDPVSDKTIQYTLKCAPDPDVIDILFDSKITDKDHQSYYGFLADKKNSSNLLKDIANVSGITDVHLSKKFIWIQRDPAFNWDDVLPEVLHAVLRNAPAQALVREIPDNQSFYDTLTKYGYQKLDRLGGAYRTDSHKAARKVYYNRLGYNLHSPTFDPDSGF